MLMSEDEDIACERDKLLHACEEAQSIPQIIQHQTLLSEFLTAISRIWASCGRV